MIDFRRRTPFVQNCVRKTSNRLRSKMYSHSFATKIHDRDCCYGDHTRTKLSKTFHDYRCGISFYLLNKQEETLRQLQIIEFQNKRTLYRGTKLTYQKWCFIG